MRLLRAALPCLLSLALGGCFLWSDEPGPKPAPVPKFTPALKLVDDWHYRTGTLDPAVLRPAVAAGSVFAAAADGTLERIENGRRLWSVRAAKALSGGVAASTRAVLVASNLGELLAFDPDKGTQLWKAQLAGEMAGVPLISNDLVIVRVGDNQVLAFNLADGKQRWPYQRAQASLSLRAHSGFAQVGDAVLAGFSGGKLVSLSMGGGFQRWESTVALPRGANELERMADLVGEPIVRSDTACVVAYQARVACVDAISGTVRWTRDIFSGYGADADDSTIYVSDSSGAIHALDLKTGSTLWKQDKLAWRGLSRPLVVGDYLAVADLQGWVHLLDRKDGHFVAQLDVDSSGINAPMVLLGKGFALQARDGTVHAISFAALSGK